MNEEQKQTATFYFFFIFVCLFAHLQCSLFLTFFVVFNTERQSTQTIESRTSFAVLPVGFLFFVFGSLVLILTFDRVPRNALAMHERPIVGCYVTTFISLVPTNAK